MTFSINERCSSAIAVRVSSISVGLTSGMFTTDYVAYANLVRSHLKMKHYMNATNIFRSFFTT
ncbi:hypothetical protein [Nostoc sp.]